MRIKLSADHKEHCEALGLKEIPKEIDVDESRFHELCSHWAETLQTTFGVVNRELLHTKVISHLVSEVKANIELPFIPAEPTGRDVIKHLRLIIIILVLILLSSLRAHCQFSHINSISFQNNGSPTTGGFFTYPFTFNCAGTLACTASGSVITLTGGGAGGGGYTTFQSGGSNLTQRAIANFANGLSCVDNPGSLRTDCTLTTATSVSHKFYNAVTSGSLVAAQPVSTDLGDFSPTPPSTAGKIPIYDPTAPNAAGGTGAYVPGDPLVQGLVADGSTTAENPVAVGGYDTAGTPALHRFTMLNGTPAGSEYGLVVRTIPSGTQTVGGTVTTTPPSNASANIAQYGGVNVGAGNAFHVQPGTASLWDVSDRSGRLLGLIANTSFAATQSGTWADRITGATGATLDAATSQNQPTPTNGISTLCEFNTTPTTITTGNSSPVQCDTNGNALVSLKTAIPAGSALIGEVVQVATATTTDSALENYLTSAATTNATSVKASAGNLYGYECINTTTTAYFLRFYNLAAAPTCSSATGFVKTVPCGAAAAAQQTGGAIRDYNAPVGYSTGIAYCLTGGGASTDNTAAAVGVYVTVKYK